MYRSVCTCVVSGLIVSGEVAPLNGGCFVVQTASSLGTKKDVYQLDLFYVMVTHLKKHRFEG